MAEKVTFSGQHLDLSEITEHYTDVELSLRQLFSSALDNEERFAGYSPTEVAEELEYRLAEEGNLVALSILAAIEAAFRVDYLQRVYAKKKDPLSRAFRELHKIKGTRASLEDEIFDTWLNCTNVQPQLIGNLRGAFKFRHWLAHGRYWKPKLGQRYDYYGVYTLAEGVFRSLPLLTN